MLIDLGEKIIKLREDKKLSQNDLSDILGISFKLLSKWETGEYVPNIEELMNISNFFEIEFEELLEEYKKGNETITEQEQKRLFKIKKSLVIKIVILICLSFACFLIVFFLCA